MKGPALSCAAVAAAMLSACDAPPFGPVGERIDGSYFLVADFVATAPGRAICYRRPAGGCDLRIAPRVVALGWDDDFVSAAVLSAGAPDARRYYYIVRDFDGPRADVARVVRGPYDEKEFADHRRKHGVPGVSDLAGAPL